MAHTITVTEDAFIALEAAAKAKGLSLSELLQDMANNVLNQTPQRLYTGEEFLRLLGATDEELALPLESDEDQD